MQPGNFAHDTRALFLAFLTRPKKPLTAAQVARATTLKQNWLSRFIHNKIPNPSLNHIQTLHDYLARMK